MAVLLPCNCTNDWFIDVHVWNVWTKREMLSGFWWGNLKGRDRLEDLGADGLIKLKSV